MNIVNAEARIKLGRDFKALIEADRMLWMPSIVHSEAKWSVVWNGRRVVVESIAERIDSMGGMAGTW